MRLAALAVAWASGFGLALHAAETVQADTDNPEAAACIRHVDGVAGPPYPAAARRAEIFGRVLAVLHFDAADQPPQVELVHRPRSAPLADSVHSWSQGLRMPCHAGGRISVRQIHQFRFVGEHSGFRDVKLSALLALARQPVDVERFVPAGMRCPLQVAWTYYQPQKPNRVKVEGEPDPALPPLVERLAQLELKLSPVAEDIAWGSTARIEIPCQPTDSVHKE